MNKKSMKTFAVVLVILLPLSAAFASGVDAGGSTDFSGETYDISVMVWTGASPGENSRTIPFIEEKFNVKINWLGVSWGQYAAARDMRVAAGDAPDIFHVLNQIRNQELDVLVEDGVALELTSQFAKYPNMAKAINDLYYVNELFGYDGELYCIPQFFGTTDLMIVIRKDWREKLGLDMPATWGDFREMLRAFKDEIEGVEYGGEFNGWAIEYSYTGYFLRTIPWALHEGEWLFRAELPGFKDSMRERVRWYDEGLVSRDPPSQAGFAYDFLNGRDGAIANAGIQLGWDELAKPLAEIDPEAELEVLVPFPAGPKGRVWEKSWGYAAMNVISADMGEEKQHRLLSIIDYLFTDEGKDMAVWGMEGVHYDVASNERVRKPETFFWDYIHDAGNWSFLTFFTGNFAASNVLTHPEIQKNTAACAEYGVPDRGSLRAPVEEADYYALLINQMKDVINAWENAWLMGEKDINNNEQWEEFMEELREAGLEEYRKALNKWGNWIE